MRDVFKMYEWQSPTGYWNCSNVQDLAHNSGAWWIPARILGLNLTDYILLLKDTYHAGNFHFYENCGKNKDETLLTFDFKNQADCHKFVLYINRIARNKKVYVC